MITTWTERDQALGLTWRGDPCDGGKTGYCSTSQHDKCPYDPVVGAFANGHASPETWIQTRTRRGQLVVATADIQVQPGAHLYRCPCDCHTPELAGRLF